MNFHVIVTLGTSTLKESVLKSIDFLGPCIYRINGAHVDEQEVLKTVRFVRRVLPRSKFLLDLPGNKVRTQNLREPIVLSKGKKFKLLKRQLNFKDFYKYVKPGDKVLAHDSIYMLEVYDVQDSAVVFLSHSEGKLLNNKGLNIPGINRDLPFVFDRDMKLIRAAKKARVDYLGISFVRTADDIRLIKKILCEEGIHGIHLIGKVETLLAAKNLGYIFQEVETILIDRGDLSADVGIFELPLYQERIIKSARRAGREVYLATQFLKNMEIHPIPLIAEIVNLHDTIKTGIDGIQLSDESAVGKYPVESVQTVFTVFNNSFSG